MTRPADIPRWAWEEADRVLGDMPEVAFEAHDIRPAWEFVARALLSAYERGRGEQREATEVAVAEVERLWEAMPYMQQIQLKFPVGARVKMSERGVQQFPSYEGKLGTVKRHASGGWSPSVHWDHRKTESSYFHEFLEVVETD